ncbi:MAG: anaerobic sulfatase maturase [Phycisphaerales bacterium]|nr:MAG: anaerobic sulfatase maturase [Phycisphaerales bacterium]
MAQPFTLLIKPSGSDCNVDCTYCFYKCRPSEIGRGRQRMSDEVLETMVRDYMRLRFPVAGFAWQGGEPTLMGLDFYKRAVELQKKYGSAGQEVGNSLQTNAILLNDEWCRFLHDSKFLVGISIDGPKEFHDYYRLDHSGGGTYDRVMRAIEKCKEHKVEFNTLTLLNARNAGHADELFDFFVELGVRFLQFIPCVELDPATGEVADFSITAKQYGDFICRFFDRWYERGPEKMSVRDFDSILAYFISGRHTICTFDKQCSQYIVIEHSGDAFCCDFFVEPRWRLGNILETPIEKLAGDSKKRAFGRAKHNLCNKCVLCRHLAVCRGGCMKDRAPFDKDNFARESYFCEAYRQFFDYTIPRFMQIAAKIGAGGASGTGPSAGPKGPVG